ncbi:ribosomal protection tetracycline resistance protein [Friedmanniella luteola]|uniref:Ribosomal protection tetracycline resistance protein n=1 Tax=Friedmanniella luteola TaxID=546871 RepID=A0A1H1VF91_9ACTN|nr:TetM/TetW/TetO/TetS family tetracycline resistance ribosomal protection protein [Friedmanniella luteola]SDS83464.1 ribosomal protection tetracycline resistance protein [Friedmanniella luteola]
MLPRALNLGILAHVDAGKTTLSERLLHAAGVIEEVGRVDHGTTVTDSLDLERRRGITIRAAVAALEIAGVAVNLVDTPGHPDFIAEVERVLDVLDGAVLVVSAVEGVQPQTRVLLRALQHRGIPCLVFVNKVDRRGADVVGVQAEIGRRLGLRTVAMGRVDGEGTAGAAAVGFRADDPDLLGPLAEVLADLDEHLLQEYVEHELSSGPALWRAELVRQTRRGLVHPLFVGSALTGTGVGALVDGIGEFLPAASGDPDGPVRGSIFKIERGHAAEKVCYLRMVSGSVRLRDQVNDAGDKVSAIQIFERGRWTGGDHLPAPLIGKVWGLAGARVGDAVGERQSRRPGHEFGLPMLESVIHPVHEDDQVALRTALAQLAEQDPLIDVRVDERHAELAVSLYGEVQREVLQATLADDYGLDVVLRPATPLYVERPRRVGTAAEVLFGPGNPFRATVGLRVAPSPPGAGVTFSSEVDHRAVPLYVYRTMEDFTRAMEHHVADTLREGLSGWPVTDCAVTLVRSGYSSPDGPPSSNGPLSTAADFRKLTPMVLMAALEQAGTAVHTPVSRVRVQAPTATTGGLLTALGRLAAEIDAPAVLGDDVVLEAVLPALDVQRLRRALPTLTSGHGFLDAEPAGHRPVRGTPPRRRRTRVDPRDREAYIAAVRPS